MKATFLATPVISFAGLIFLSAALVLSAPPALADPPVINSRFDFSPATTPGARKFVFETIPNHRYRLWRSTGLNAWTVVPGYPQTASGMAMEHTFSQLEREFFRIEPLGEPQPAPAGFALIPAGAFQMGDQSSPPVGDWPELPVHSVTLSAFYMGTTEVTKAQWDATYTYAIANGYSFSNVGSGKASNHPVHSVTWYDVVRWCNARSQQEGLLPCYFSNAAILKSVNIYYPVTCDFTKNGYRLPTEAEWEKAARGGLTAQNFPWGLNTITHSQANYYSESRYSFDTSPTRGYHPTYAKYPQPFTSPAGAFAPNAYGLYDMAGNISEWCWDWRSPYQTGAGANDPTGPSTGSYRVLRGGDWGFSAPHNTRVSNRSNWDTDPNYWSSGMGFRLARGRL